MKVSDVVVPISSEFQLASGCSRYSHAIVVSENPFVLASEHGDMRWSATVKKEQFRVIGTAKESTMKQCIHRAIS